MAILNDVRNNDTNNKYRYNKRKKMTKKGLLRIKKSEVFKDTFKSLMYFHKYMNSIKLDCG